jgi:hypothetical protein
MGIYFGNEMTICGKPERIQELYKRLQESKKGVRSHRPDIWSSALEKEEENLEEWKGNGFMELDEIKVWESDSNIAKGILTIHLTTKSYPPQEGNYFQRLFSKYELDEIGIGSYCYDYPSFEYGYIRRAEDLEEYPDGVETINTHEGNEVLLDDTDQMYNLVTGKDSDAEWLPEWVLENLGQMVLSDIESKIEDAEEYDLSKEELEELKALAETL